MNGPAKPAESRTPLARHLAERIRRARAYYLCGIHAQACLYDPEWGLLQPGAGGAICGFLHQCGRASDIRAAAGAPDRGDVAVSSGAPAEFTIVGSRERPRAGWLLADSGFRTAAQLPDFYSALRYVAVEASAGRRGQHAAALAGHIDRGRCRSSAELPAEIPIGVILSNELFDALPVHRVTIEHGELQEFYVRLRDGELAEEPGKPSTPALGEYFNACGVTLLEGQLAEAGLEACRWIEDAGRRLGRGFVLTVDYGRWARELYDQWHMRGTLLAYSAHRTSEDFLRAPGTQDLTAHVNFTALDLWGQRQGLACAGCVSQLAFLIALGRGNEFEDLYEPGASELDRTRARLMLKTLIHPEGMGETFQVFIQYKGLPEAPQLTGLAGIWRQGVRRSEWGREKKWNRRAKASCLCGGGGGGGGSV